jgi:hypothetical protein
MLGDLAQSSHISLDELRRAMVVVEHRQHLIHDGMVCLPKANVDAEYGMYDAKDDTVY